MPTQQMWCGDSLAAMRGMPYGAIKTIVTSPPYNLGVKYGSYADKRPQAEYLAWMQQIFEAMKDVLQDDGHLFLQMGGVPTHPLIPFEVLQEALRYFVLQNEIIWVKAITVGEQSTGHYKPVNSPRFLNNTHEVIFHLTKTGRVPVDRLAIGVPYQDKSNQKRWAGAGEVRCGGNSWFIPYDTIQSGAEKFNHPAIYPVELASRCIKLSNPAEDEIVFDPFAGIGTTLLAAQALNRTAIGWDMDADYVAFARKRLEHSL